MTTHYNQTFLEASDGAGHTRRFYFDSDAMIRAAGFGTSFDDALAQASDWSTSAGGLGYVALMGRSRLNDYVGSPMWSDPEMIKEF